MVDTPEFTCAFLKMNQPQVFHGALEIRINYGIGTDQEQVGQAAFYHLKVGLVVFVTMGQCSYHVRVLGKGVFPGDVRIPLDETGNNYTSVKPGSATDANWNKTEFGARKTGMQYAIEGNLEIRTQRDGRFALISFVGDGSGITVTLSRYVKE